MLTGTPTPTPSRPLPATTLIRASAAADTLNGGDGSDLLDGGTGNDRLNGGAGIDLVRYRGSDRGHGRPERRRRHRQARQRDRHAHRRSRARSAPAPPTSSGATGSANYFQGGAGKDTFTGGGGRDLYDFDRSAQPGGQPARDVITDFVHLIDDLDLTGIDADVTVAGDQAFRFVGTAALGTTPGAVGYFVSGGNTIVRGSTDTDIAAEFEIQLTAPPGGVQFEDFYF